MIKPWNMPQLSSAKPRSGLQSIADLVPRLIRHYEILAEVRQQSLRGAVKNSTYARNSAGSVPPASTRQFTFGWDE
jgi:hypothetical protein